MTLPIVWLPEAEKELKDAIVWYTDIRPELGRRFSNSVNETIEAIVSGPFLFATVQRNRRRAGVKRFPYGLFFVSRPDDILVVACFHGKRSPRYWTTRQVKIF